jgi:conjugal transfer/type IV secretion protein DotA/TraY
MNSLFTVAPNDQSIFYLYQIFGTMETDFPSGFQTISTLMSAMFQSINTVALVLGSIMVVYTTVAGILKTAHEGEFLGKNWNSLWVPLRTVMGISSLFPTAAGYSLLQIMMMWFIVQGVGAADTVWNSVINFLNTNHSPYGGIVAGGSSAGTSASSGGTATKTVTSEMSQLFQLLSCQASALRTDPDGVGTSSYSNAYYCAVPLNATSKFCTAGESLTSLTDSPQLSTNAPKNTLYTLQFGPSGACGNIQFPNPQTYIDTTNTAAQQNGTPIPACTATDVTSVMTCAGLKAQIPALQAVIDTMASTASLVAEADHDYLEFSQGMVYPSVTGGTKPPPILPIPTPEWINNYCKANNIASNACCTLSNYPNSKTCQPNTSFPAPFINDASSPTAYTNTSAAAAGLYWTYNILPVLSAAQSNIPQIMTSAYQLAISTAVSAATPPVSGWMATAESNGWLLAGAYYFQIASMSSSMTSAKMPPLGVQVTDSSSISSTSMGNYRNNLTTASTILSSITSSNSSIITNSPLPANFQSAGGLIGDATNDVISAFQGLISNASWNSNPVLAAQSFGENLIGQAMWIYGVYIGVASAILVAGYFDFMALGSGDPTSPLGAMVNFLVNTTMTLIFIFEGWAFSFGGMLAVYLPLVPYIIFTFSAIGWFTSVLEAMVAAPFVALGVLSPSGQHEILGRAEPGVLILLNTFLRPTLTVFGMMGGMLLAPVVISMINTGFGMVMFTVNNSPGPAETFIFISCYSTFVISAMNKCFATIYLVPERVLMWIGGQGASYGEAEGLGAVKASAEKASSAAGQFASGSLKALDKIKPKKKKGGGGGGAGGALEGE